MDNKNMCTCNLQAGCCFLDAIIFTAVYNGRVGCLFIAHNGIVKNTSHITITLLGRCMVDVGYLTEFRPATKM